MDPRVRLHTGLRTRVSSTRHRLRRLTASVTSSVTAGGVMLAGMPFALEYVVAPGDTLSKNAVRHDTTVERRVRRGLDRPAARVGADERRIVHYTVRPGDTPSGLAVRFHAWTAELIAMNGPVLGAGERIRIPVVVAAARKARRAAAPGAAPARRHAAKRQAASHPPWRQTTGHAADPGRATVRRVIAATARRHGVDPDLALAVSWQEAGWQMHHVSSTGAIGAMQVMPATGRWMSDVFGTTLHLRDLHDNATAGVLLLDLLLEQTRLRRAVAGYYQGLEGVRRHGMYEDTKRYVANVLALKRRFDRGHYPG